MVLYRMRCPTFSIILNPNKLRLTKMQYFDIDYYAV